MKAADLFPFRSEVRPGTLQAVQNLSEAQLEWKPAGGIHTIMSWLRHVAQSEDWWIRGVVMQNPQFVPRRRVELVDLASVLKYLESTRSTTEGLLNEWPSEKLIEVRPIPPGFKGADRGPTLSLHWIMGNLYDHERHHRAHIYLHLRLMGIEPPLY